MADNKNIKPGIQAVPATEENKVEDSAAQVEEIELDKEEEKSHIRMHEEDFIQGLIEAAGFAQGETQRIEIAREGKLYFAFNIRPLSEEEYDKQRKKHTKYVRNKQFGMKLPEETNNVKYRSALIYAATTDEDKAMLWDNKKVWEALKSKGLSVMTGTDVIDYTLKAGEKDKVIEAIDDLSGYDSNLEEVAKN